MISYINELDFTSNYAKGLILPVIIIYGDFHKYKRSTVSNFKFLGNITKSPTIYTDVKISGVSYRYEIAKNEETLYIDNRLEFSHLDSNAPKIMEYPVFCDYFNNNIFEFTYNGSLKIKDNELSVEISKEFKSDKKRLTCLSIMVGECLACRGVFILNQDKYNFPITVIEWLIGLFSDLNNGSQLVVITNNSCYMKFVDKEQIYIDNGIDFYRASQFKGVSNKNVRRYYDNGNLGGQMDLSKCYLSYLIKDKRK